MNAPALSDDFETPTLLQRYLAAQLAGDRTRAVRVLIGEGLEQGKSEETLRDVIRHAQIRVGELWEAGEITVAEEHMATAVSQLALSYLYARSSSKAATNARVLIACVPGDRHDFPARLAADALDLAGFEVRFLGAGVSSDDFVRAVEKFRPAFVALTITMAAFKEHLAREVTELRARFPGLPIFVGGRASDVALPEGVTVDFCGTSARELLDAALAVADPDAAS